MHAAEIVERDVQRDGGEVTFQALAKAVLNRANRFDPMRSVKFWRST
jgi:hypothetical protein